ncbi:uncharacterized protein LOC129600442 [Paramacrobiotus metropolitanus]|uniref:uncharacterized protein LOC129600442 n=1 Tax=Paramacrobiotus metropolitanus TaxID=2943436 RepID=UPI0024462A8A|nr:uncharacterized protein LOC129600442 [Paramacrobiotus metropolitanus]
MDRDASMSTTSSIAGSSTTNDIIHRATASATTAPVTRTVIWQRPGPGVGSTDRRRAEMRQSMYEDLAAYGSVEGGLDPRQLASELETLCYLEARRLNLIFVHRLHLVHQIRENSGSRKLALDLLLGNMSCQQFATYENNGSSDLTRTVSKGAPYYSYICCQVQSTEYPDYWRNIQLPEKLAHRFFD